jgi:hypothetical protein
MAKIDAPGLLPGAEPLRELVYRQPGTDGPIRMICLLVRSAEKCEHRVADEFGNHAAFVKNRSHTFSLKSPGAKNSGAMNSLSVVKPATSVNRIEEFPLFTHSRQRVRRHICV